MKKPIIITGPPMSGKSFFARNILLMFGDNPIEFDGRNFDLADPWCFADLTPETDLILIDDIRSLHSIESVLNKDVFLINKRFGPVIEVLRPWTIIVAEDDIITQDFINKNISKYIFIECDYNENKVFSFKKLTPETAQL
ncbi:MAG TPA: hypothetical protein VLY84_00075 [Dysgonamonadaceae bacterium]|nr:hypothetical protein [Dysgonamonadaceae bacterium]